MSRCFHPSKTTLEHYRLKVQNWPPKLRLTNALAPSLFEKNIASSDLSKNPDENETKRATIIECRHRNLGVGQTTVWTAMLDSSDGIAQGTSIGNGKSLTRLMLDSAELFQGLGVVYRLGRRHPSYSSDSRLFVPILRGVEVFPNRFRQA